MNLDNDSWEHLPTTKYVNEETIITWSEFFKTKLMILRNLECDNYENLLQETMSSPCFGLTGTGDEKSSEMQMTIQLLNPDGLSCSYMVSICCII